MNAQGHSIMLFWGISQKSSYQAIWIKRAAV